jgi:hypothetical protein
MRSFLATVFLVLAVPWHMTGHDAAAKTTSEFNDRIKGNGSITFRSWNGKAFRMDSDTELTFFPHNAVHMFEWGYALASYRGTYQITSDGKITAQFKRFDAWKGQLLAFPDAHG